MINFGRLPPILLILAAFAFFWIIASIVDFYVLLEIVSAFYLGAILAVLILFGRTAAIALITVGGIDRGQQAALGICLIALGAELHRIYHLWWRTLGEPLDIINRDVVTFFIFIVALGGMTLVTTQEPSGRVVPPLHWRRIAFALALGGVVAGFVIGVYGGPPP